MLHYHDQYHDHYHYPRIHTPNHCQYHFHHPIQYHHPNHYNSYQAACQQTLYTNKQRTVEGIPPPQNSLVQ